VYYADTIDQWQNISIGSNNNYLTDATIYYNGIAYTPWKYFTYKQLSDGTYSVTDTSSSSMPANVIIAPTYNGKAVTTLGSQAFYN
jgi:hypothetical protein